MQACLTNEHFDHSGATCFFFQTAVAAAHRLAANKIALQDDLVTMIRSADATSVPFRADVWLEAGLPSLSGGHRNHRWVHESYGQLIYGTGGMS